MKPACRIKPIMAVHPGAMREFFADCSAGNKRNCFSPGDAGPAANSGLVFVVRGLLGLHQDIDITSSSCRESLGIRLPNRAWAFQVIRRDIWVHRADNTSLMSSLELACLDIRASSTRSGGKAMRCASNSPFFIGLHQRPRFSARSGRSMGRPGTGESQRNGKRRWASLKFFQDSCTSPGARK